MYQADFNRFQNFYHRSVRYPVGIEADDFRKMPEICAKYLGDPKRMKNIKPEGPEEGERKRKCRIRLSSAQHEPNPFEVSPNPQKITSKWRSALRRAPPVNYRWFDPYTCQRVFAFFPLLNNDQTPSNTLKKTDLMPSLTKIRPYPVLCELSLQLFLCLAPKSAPSVHWLSFPPAA